MFCDMQAGTSAGTVDGEGPAWAPLRDGYMLTNPKLKDWDKMQVKIWRLRFFRLTNSMLSLLSHTSLTQDLQCYFSP